MKSSSSHWGKYGIITEVECVVLCSSFFANGGSSLLYISIFSKRAEFHAWLVEERKVNPETLTKDQERKEFAKFIEDYNTGAIFSPYSSTIV
jgi:hypothetical protein